MKRREVRIETRVDPYGNEDVPKTVAGIRTIPLGAGVLSALSAWRERTAFPDDNDTLFLNHVGTYTDHRNMVTRMPEDASDEEDRFARTIATIGFEDDRTGALRLARRPGGQRQQSVGSAPPALALSGRGHVCIARAPRMPSSLSEQRICVISTPVRLAAFAVPYPVTGTPRRSP